MLERQCWTARDGDEDEDGQERDELDEAETSLEHDLRRQTRSIQAATYLICEDVELPRQRVSLVLGAEAKRLKVADESAQQLLARVPLQ